MKPGDVIVAANGQRIDSGSALHNLEGLLPVGQAVKLDLQRDGKQQQAKVTLGQPPGAKEAAKPELTPPRPKPLLPAASPPTVEQLQRRIEQLERRVEQLEKALAEALKKP